MFLTITSHLIYSTPEELRIFFILLVESKEFKISIGEKQMACHALDDNDLLNW